VHVVHGVTAREHDVREAGADRPAAREEAGARWRAIGRRRVEGVEDGAFGGEPVDARRRERAASVSAEVAVAEVVEQDDDDVGARGASCGTRLLFHPRELAVLARERRRVVALLVRDIAERRVERGAEEREKSQERESAEAAHEEADCAHHASRVAGIHTSVSSTT